MHVQGGNTQTMLSYALVPGPHFENSINHTTVQGKHLQHVSRCLPIELPAK